MRQSFEQPEIIVEEPTVEARVHEMQQEFDEKRKEVLEAERTHTKPRCNMHYGTLSSVEIERIDEQDLLMWDEIRNARIYTEEDYQRVREKFDEYFLNLSQEKIHVGGLLAIDLRNKQAEFLRRRSHR